MCICTKHADVHAATAYCQKMISEKHVKHGGKFLVTYVIFLNDVLMNCHNYTSMAKIHI